MNGDPLLRILFIRRGWECTITKPCVHDVSDDPPLHLLDDNTQRRIDMTDSCSNGDATGSDFRSFAGKSAKENASTTATTAKFSPREFVLVLGDFALADLNEDSGLASVSSYSTVAELLCELHEWIEVSVEDTDDAHQPRI
ncbi:MAG: hypothetical protein ABIP55_05750 [Tepidisphaeraceae bacterium]